MPDYVKLVAIAISGVDNPEDRWLRKAEKALEALKNVIVKKTVTCPKCKHRWRAETHLAREPRNFGLNNCIICNTEFTKRHPHQQICMALSCKIERDRRYNAEWQRKNR